MHTHDHQNELNALLKNDFDKLSDEYLANEVALKWTEEQDQHFELNKFKAASQINNLKINPKLKLFLLQNYLDKLATRVNNTSRQQGRNAAQFFLAGEVDSYPARYVLNGVQVNEVQSWDIGEHQGQIDPISGKYFAEYLGELDKTRDVGWHDDDADSNFHAYTVKFSFIDRETKNIDSFTLLFNAAQDTNWENEDYSFCAIVANDKNHVVNDYWGDSVPSIFGKSISFNELRLHNNGANIDCAYIMSAHETDTGSDDEWGNYLNDLPISPLEGREGNRSLKNVAHDVFYHVFRMLNDGYTGDYDFNYLHINQKDGGIIFFDGNPGTPELQRIPIKGIEDWRENYNLLKPDVTVVRWDTQHIVEMLYSTFLNETFEQRQEFEKSIDALSTLKDVSMDVINSLISILTEKSAEIARKQDELGLRRLFPTAGADLSAINWIKDVDWSDWKQVVTKTTTEIGRSFFVAWLEKSIEVNYVRKGMNPEIAKAAAKIIAGVIGSLSKVAQVENLKRLFPTYDDHGMLDWNFQMTNNRDVMAKIAFSFSRDYQNGIEWKIVDTWSSIPDLYIKGQDQSNSEWTKLSNNGQFNDRNKIQFISRK